MGPAASDTWEFAVCQKKILIGQELGGRGGAIKEWSLFVGSCATLRRFKQETSQTKFFTASQKKKVSHLNINMATTTKKSHQHLISQHPL